MPDEPRSKAVPVTQRKRWYQFWFSLPALITFVWFIFLNWVPQIGRDATVLGFDGDLPSIVNSRGWPFQWKIDRVFKEDSFGDEPPFWNLSVSLAANFVIAVLASICVGYISGCLLHFARHLRLHLSTMIAMMFVYGVLIGLNAVPREFTKMDIQSSSDPAVYVVAYYSHADRRPDLLTEDRFLREFWKTRGWPVNFQHWYELPNGRYDYILSKLALAIDIIVACVFVLSFAFLCEWMIRRRTPVETEEIAGNAPKKPVH